MAPTRTPRLCPNSLVCREMWCEIFECGDETRAIDPLPRAHRRPSQLLPKGRMSFFDHTPRLTCLHSIHLTDAVWRFVRPICLAINPSIRRLGNSRGKTQFMNLPGTTAYRVEGFALLKAVQITSPTRSGG